MVTIDERVDPVDALTVLPVKNRDALTLVAGRVLTEELGLSGRVVVACEVVEPKRDAVGNALLHKAIAGLVNEIKPLSRLNDHSAKPTVLHYGRNIKPSLPIRNVNKLHAHICSSFPPP